MHHVWIIIYGKKTGLTVTQRRTSAPTVITNQQDTTYVHYAFEFRAVTRERDSEYSYRVIETSDPLRSAQMKCYVMNMKVQ